jgi:hypothetical protein
MTGYAYGCREECCKAAARAPKPGIIKHGTHSGYSHFKCRCDECKAAEMEYRRINPNIVECNRKYYRDNCGHLNARRRQWGKENREKSTASARARRAANPERYAAVQRAWREANRDWRREWKRANPNKIRAMELRRRARKLEAFIENVDPAKVYARDNWTCHICGEKVDRKLKHPDPLSASLDHVRPLSKGGLHSYANCAASHLQCNLRKHANILAV